MAMRKFSMWVVTFALLTAAGCKSNPQDEKAAMRAALESYLSQRGNLNMAGMDMDIQVVRNDGKTADVNVLFRAKQGGGSMQMAYQLERQGDRWMVKGSRSGAGAGHPAVGDTGGAELPAAHPPLPPPQPAPQAAPSAPAKKP